MYMNSTICRYIAMELLRFRYSPYWKDYCIIAARSIANSSGNLFFDELEQLPELLIKRQNRSRGYVVFGGKHAIYEVK